MKRKKFKKIVASFTMVSILAGMGFVTPQTKVKANEGDITSDLVAQWKFDGNITESISNINTEAGAQALTYTDGIHDQAAVFNGTSQYLVADACEALDLGSTIQQNTDAFTISMWLNLGDCKDTIKYILDKGHAEWQDDYYYDEPYRLYINGSGLSVDLSNVYDDNTDNDYETEGNTYLENAYADGMEWFLYTVTYDGEKIKIYHNNSLIKQENYTDGITKNYMDLFIGADYDLEQFYKGEMDDLRMYKRTLSYDDVEALYQAGVTANKEALNPTKQLVAYYKFDGNLNDATSFANNGEEVSTSGSINYGDGKSGKALTMKNGKYFEIPCADQLNFNNEYTISFWVKSDCTDSRPILCRKNPAYGSNDNDNECSYSIYTDTWADNNNFYFNMDIKKAVFDSWCPVNGGSINYSASYSDDKIKSNQWKHVAFTYSNGELKYYLNGVLKKTEVTDTVNTNIANSAGSLLIGYDGETFFQGSLDELKIYNKCLNITEVSTEYKRVNCVSIDSTYTNRLAKLKRGNTTTISNVKFKDINTAITSTVASSSSAVTFKSSNTKIATVTSSGVVKGIKDGSTYITATYKGFSKSTKVTIKSDSIYLTSANSKKIGTIKKGKSVTIPSIQVKDGFTGKVTTVKSSNSKVTFASSNKKVFTVTNSGVLKGVANGTAKLTIKYGVYQKTYTVKVKSDTLSVTSTVKSKLTSIKKNKTYTVSSIKVKDAITGKTSTVKSSNKYVTFASSNKKIFTVTSSGKITGKKAGTAKLTIKYNGFSVTYTVKVK